MTRRDEVSIHEVGHAVCAHLLGKKYACALHGEGDAAGGTAGPGDQTKEMPDFKAYADADWSFAAKPLSLEVLDDMTVTAAGAVAVAIAKNVLPVVRNADRLMLQAAATGALPHDPQRVVWALEQLAIERAKHHLAPVFHVVRDMATELSASGSLTADHIEKALSRAGALLPPRK